MATKKGNGHDLATTAIVEALGRIEKQAEATNKQLRATNERLGRVETRLEGMAEDLSAVRADVSSLKTELTSLRGETRAEIALHHEEIPARVRKLEEAVFKRTGT